MAGTHFTHCSGPRTHHEVRQRVIIHREFAGIVAATDEGDEDGNGFSEQNIFRRPTPLLLFFLLEVHK